MNRLQPFLLPIICLVWLCQAAVSFAQNRPPLPERDLDRDPYAERFRNRRQCSEPYPMRSFNRDYASLSSTSTFFINREFRSYVRQRCLTSEQVRRLAILIPTDREKYDFLKYSLDYVFDIDNYASTGSAMSNLYSRDVFFRHLLRQGVPVGGYFDDGRFRRDNNNCCNTCPPPVYQYPDRRYNDPRDDFYTDREWDNVIPNNNRNNGNQPNAPSRRSQEISEREFEMLKNRIKDAGTFDNNRLDIAKTLTQENALSARQIADITRMFTYDANRLNYAKFAYDFAIDNQNFGSVRESLAFDINKRDFERFLAEKR